MNLRASSGILITSGWPGGRLPGAPAPAAVSAAPGALGTCWCMMYAAAPRPATKIRANTTANAVVIRGWAGALVAPPAADAGPFGASAGFAAEAPNAVPQLTQNFAPGTTGVPHC